MKTLGGQLSMTNLPTHQGLIVSLAFYKVDGPDSAIPNGDHTMPSKTTWNFLRTSI